MAATGGLVWGAIVAWQTAKQNLPHLCEDSRNQTRPYVSVSIVPSIGGTSAWDLVIVNSGKSAARDLTVKVSAWPEDDTVITALRNMFDTPQTLAPGMSIRTYWSLGESKKPKNVDPVGFLDAVDLTAAYGSDDDEAPDYSMTVRLDTKAMGMTPQGGSGINLPSGAPAHEKKLAEIVRALNEFRR